MTNFTDEQVHILDLAKKTPDNLMFRAYAGCGKTSTLEAVQAHVSSKYRPSLYLVFNKRNQLEAADRMPSSTEVKTFNSMGHGIWAKAIAKRLTLNFQKTKELFKGVADELRSKAERDVVWEAYYEVSDAVAKAKAIGYVPKGKFETAKRLCTPAEFWASLESVPDDLVMDLTNEVLTRSILAAYEGNIDFNDQIYMPALFGGTYPQFPLTLVDEHQDLNATNLEMVRKLVGNRRFMGVGDPFQNIYAFRGAKHRSMQDSVERYNMVECPLSTSFRCPSEIVKHVQWRVPDFRWLNEGGEVVPLDRLALGDFIDDSVIICRNNAPLFALAMRLLASGRSVSVAGTDIGPKLIAIMKKFGSEDASRAEVLEEIERWLEAKLARESTTAEDMANCMRVFAEHGDTLGQAIAYANHLFEQKGRLFFTTGHKAKGLEWNVVYHLDPHLCRDTEQDRNLRYVISTRSRNLLIEIASRNIE